MLFRTLIITGKYCPNIEYIREGSSPGTTSKLIVRHYNATDNCAMLEHGAREIKRITCTIVLIGETRERHARPVVCSRQQESLKFGLCSDKIYLVSYILLPALCRIFLQKSWTDVIISRLKSSLV